MRGGAENVRVESRGSKVASVAQSRHGFGRWSLKTKLTAGAR